MQATKTKLLAFLITFATASAQYVPPSPPAPAPGFIDAWVDSADASLSNWDFGVNERLRFEDKTGAGTTHAGSNYDFASAPPTTNSNDYWLSRLMPRVGYAGDWFSAVVEARSSYSFGDDRYNAASAGDNLPEDDGPVQIEMAYVLIGNPKRLPLSLKVGRQELNYGEGRLVGNAFWLNIPHTFDAVKLRYQDSFLGVDLFAANLVYTRENHFDESNPQDTLSGAYFDFPGLSSTNVTETYVFARNVARGILTDDWAEVPAPFRFTAPQDLYTFGYRTKSKPGALGPLDYGIEGMWQTGDRTAVFPATALKAALSDPRLRQDAWAFILQGSYTWKAAPLSPRVAAIVSMASGDRNSTDTSSQTFQNLLPSNHGLYGAMDLSSLENIEDYRASFSVTPSPTTSLTLDAHQQYLENTHDYWYNVAGVPRSTPGAAPGSGKGFGINPGYSPDLGQEVDAVAGWKAAKGVVLEGGLGHFFRGEYVKESFRVTGSRDAEYGYVQVTLNL